MMFGAMLGAARRGCVPTRREGTRRLDHLVPTRCVGTTNEENEV